MSQHIEWVGPEYLELHSRGSEIGENTVDEEFALVLGFDDLVVIEGSEEDLRKLAQRILDVLDAATGPRRIGEAIVAQQPGPVVCHNELPTGPLRGH